MFSSKPKPCLSFKYTSINTPKPQEVSDGGEAPAMGVLGDLLLQNEVFFVERNCRNNTLSSIVTEKLLK